MDVFIGWDAREDEVADVCAFSIKRRNVNGMVTTSMIKLPEMRSQNLYWRETEIRDGHLWDVISESPMSTEFAISRFLLPHICAADWAIFCDCDFLWLSDVSELMNLISDQYAVSCVKHKHVPKEVLKMDSQFQSKYPRKNWSSMMVWNLKHPANKRLTIEHVNSLPGRDLHRFCWLEEDEIGEVPVEWNWLEGTSDKSVKPKVVHYTRGGPWFDQWQDVEYADLWINERDEMYKLDPKYVKK